MVHETGGQTATLTVQRSTPGRWEHVGASRAGGGPTSSLWGDLLLDPPYLSWQWLTDATGTQNKDFWVPVGQSGVDVWLHSLDPVEGALSNGLALTVQ